MAFRPMLTTLPTMSSVGAGSVEPATGPIPEVGDRTTGPIPVVTTETTDPGEAEAAPADTHPGTVEAATDTASTDTMPTDTMPTDTMPTDTAPTGAGSPQAGTDPDIRWRRIRKQAGVAYLVVIVAVIALAGIPTDRGSLTLLVLVGLAIPCLGKGWVAYGRVLLDWLPFTAALILYDYSRGLAHLFGRPLHIADVASIDRDVFGVVPTVWLQQHYQTPGAVHWYDAAATLVYVTHFLATPIVAAVLWLRNRELWLAFVRRVLGLAVAGLVTYVLYPAAPPWYASRVGAIGPVVRGASRGWFWLHINHAGNLLQEGQAASNQVAAMPSLHTGYATIIALFVLTTVRNRLAWLMLLYPAAMAISLVYLGEHYVIDVVAGVVYAIAIHTAMNAYEGWQDNRRLKRARNAVPYTPATPH